MLGRLSKLRSWYPKLASFIPTIRPRKPAKSRAAMMSMDLMDEGFKYSMSTRRF